MRAKRGRLLCTRSTLARGTEEAQRGPQIRTRDLPLRFPPCLTFPPWKFLSETKPEAYLEPLPISRNLYKPYECVPDTRPYILLELQKLAV